MVSRHKRKRPRKRPLLSQERTLLRVLGEQRALRLDQVPLYLTLLERKAASPLPKSTTSNLVERLQHARLIHLEPMGTRTPLWIWLSSRGLRVLGMTASSKPPARAILPVLHAANTLRLLLTQHDPQIRWISRPYASHTASALSCTAELQIRGEQRIAIEMLWHLDGSDAQRAAYLREHLEGVTSRETSPCTALWYYAPQGVARALREARALLTEEEGSRIGISSYPPLYERVLVHQAPIRALSWSPDGTHLAAVSKEGLSVWDLTTGTPPVYRALEAVSPCLCWSCDGAWVVLGNEAGKLSLWQRATGKLFVLPTEPRERIASLAPLRGDRFACILSDGRLLRYSLPKRIQQADEIHLPPEAEALAWSADGKRLALIDKDASIRLFALSDGQLVRTITLPKGVGQTLACSPDGHLLASGSLDGTIHLWEARRDILYETIESGMLPIRHLCWAPSGDLLACVGSSSHLQIWQVSTRRLLASYEEHTGAIIALSWSPGGTHLAAASEDGTVLLYSIDRPGDLTDPCFHPSVSLHPQGHHHL